MSALIWLAIVGVWGFVLIPMWLRHHDGSLEQRSTDKFSTAMRVLSRRGGRDAEPDDAELDDAELDRAELDRAELDRAELDRAELDGLELDEQAPELDEEMDPAGRPEQAGARPRGQMPPAPVEELAAGGGVPGEVVPGEEALSGRALDGGELNRGVARRRNEEVNADGVVADSHRARAHRDPVDGADETAHTVPVGAARPMAPARRGDPRARVLRRLRRQRLIVLSAAVPITVTLAAVLAGMWIVVQLLVDAGLALYLGHLRRAARTERRLVASRAARDERIAVERAIRRSGGPTPRERPATAPRPAPAVAGPARATRPNPSAGRPHISTGRSGRPATPEYIPVRLSGDALSGDALSGDALSGDAAPLTEEELAHARAETVELGGYAAATVDVTGVGQAPAAPLAGEGHPVENYTNNVRVSATRPAGRPGVRPPTSKPGRVQINPPGTHGGLTAPPATTAPAAAPAAAPAPAPATEKPAGPDADVPVLRPAVGS